MRYLLLSIIAPLYASAINVGSLFYYGVVSISESEQRAPLTFVAEISLEVIDQSLRTEATEGERILASGQAADTAENLDLLNAENPLRDFSATKTITEFGEFEDFSGLGLGEN